MRYKRRGWADRPPRIHLSTTLPTVAACGYRIPTGDRLAEDPNAVTCRRCRETERWRARWARKMAAAAGG